MLNEKTIAALVEPKIHYFAGSKAGGRIAPRGFGLRVMPSGVKSWVIRYSIANHQRLLVIGQYPDWPVVKAVEEAVKLRQRIDRSDDPLVQREAEQAAARDTLKNICEEYFRRDGKDLRSREEQERALKRLVYPVLGDRDIATIKRLDIVRMLDAIQDENGTVMADRTLAYIRKIFNWHATRSNEFASPIVPGMARSKNESRERTLTDDELKAVWKAAEASGTVYGRLLRFILLTGARRSEASELPWDELKDGVWDLPKARNKTKRDLARPLSPQALGLLGEPHGPFVFTTNGNAAIAGFSKFKLDFDEACGVSDWTLHDLRRTARTLMSRAGVPDEIGEQCIGHVKGGVKEIYNRWKYLPQMREAYAALAGLIERIVNPVDNVIRLGAQAT
jgi:integrase